MLPTTYAFAGGITPGNDLGSNRRAAGSGLLISDNTGYDGASLPPPGKKKNQVTINTDDTVDDTAPRKKKNKKQVDVDTDNMSTMNSSDPSPGAALPAPKKMPRPAEAANAKPNNLANDRDGRPGGDKKGNHDTNIFGKGPLDLTALSLTDEQKQKIGQMHADNGAKMRDLMRKRRDLSTQMRDLMFDADVTEAQIRGKRDEVRQVQEKLEDIRLNDFLAIRSVLTADQRQKLKDVKIANSRRDGENASNPQNPAASSNPSNATAKRADNNDQKRLADTPK